MIVQPLTPFSHPHLKIFLHSRLNIPSFVNGLAHFQWIPFVLKDGYLTQFGMNHISNVKFNRSLTLSKRSGQYFALLNRIQLQVAENISVIDTGTSQCLDSGTPNTLELSLLCFSFFPLFALPPRFLKKFQLSAGFTESEPLSAPCNFKKKPINHMSL